MKYGIISGMAWALDTLVLGIALACVPFIHTEQALAFASVTSAFFHDLFCAFWMFIYTALKGRLSQTIAAVKTKSGLAIVVGALLGGPVGMTGYLIAINNIGVSYTAIISTFYPAFGTFLALVFLKERMSLVQIIALFVALLGIVYMGFLSLETSHAGNSILGVVGALLCVFAWGSEAVLGAWGMRSEVINNETALHIRETTSAIVYGLLVIPLFGSWDFVSLSFFTPANGIILGAALIGTISYLAYYKAISVIGAARGMAANVSYSAWAVVFSLIFLQEIPSVPVVICCIIIMGGTILASADYRSLLKKSAS
ncbi:MAG: DMT family transporter [Coriobacteriia bacterium]|nr:DMT family transporter [Coriobacteriia bacterium]